MHVLFNGGTARSVIGSARALLTSLDGVVGSTGLAAAGHRPGLLALVDQHAAAVRDSLDGDRRPLTVAALGGYAEGLRAAAVEHGWSPPTGPVDWTAADWTLLRLLAVCLLADGLGPQRSTPHR